MSYPFIYNSDTTVLWGGFNQRETFQSKNTDHTVINVSHQEFSESDYWIPLNDGVYDSTESTDNFAEAVNTTRNQLQNENPIFVHCAYGQSRSVMVLATALSAEKDISLDQVLSTMKESYSDIDPAPQLQTKAKVYLRHTTRHNTV